MKNETPNNTVRDDVPAITTDLACPQCGSILLYKPGSKTRPEGFTLFCDSATCPSQEVIGYGETVKAAFKVITEKYAKAD